MYRVCVCVPCALFHFCISSGSSLNSVCSVNNKQSADFRLVLVQNSFCLARDQSSFLLTMCYAQSKYGGIFNRIASRSLLLSFFLFFSLLKFVVFFLRHVLILCICTGDGLVVCVYLLSVGWAKCPFSLLQEDSVWVFPGNASWHWVNKFFPRYVCVCCCTSRAFLSAASFAAAAGALFVCAILLCRSIETLRFLIIDPTGHMSVDNLHILTAACTLTSPDGKWCVDVSGPRRG